MGPYRNIIHDGSNLAYRADSVLDLTAPGGQRISAVYGVVKMLLAIQRRFSVKKTYIAWDTGLSKRRKIIFSEYKKKVMTEEEKNRKRIFKEQVEICKVFCKAMGVISAEYPETEADDIIYLLAKELYKGEERKTLIISTDKDFLQLVNDGIDVLNPISDVLYTDENFYSLTGMYPFQFSLFRSIVGDHSDGIEGIKGVGEKRALIAIKQDVKNLLSSENPINEKWAELVRQNRELVVRNYSLIDFGVQEYDEGLVKYVKSCIDRQTFVNYDVIDALLKKYAFQIDLKEFFVFSEPE